MAASITPSPKIFSRRVKYLIQILLQQNTEYWVLYRALSLKVLCFEKVYKSRKLGRLAKDFDF